MSKPELFCLLIDGKLRVKFNVSRTKDHGTKWSFQNRETVPIQKVVQTNEVKEEVIEDFFSDF